MIIDHTNKCWDELNGKKAVVLHTDLGTYMGTYDWIFNGPKSVSYNYYVRKNGEVHEWVPAYKQAWHAGTVYNPTPQARSVIGDTNPNRVTVGVCYEGRGEKATEKQVSAIVGLLRSQSLEKLPLFAHVEITDYKPKVVLDCKERVQRALKGECTLGQFSTVELWRELYKRIRA